MSTTNVANKFMKSIKGYHMVRSCGFLNADECQILSILLDDNGCVRSLTLDEAVYDDGQYEWSDDGKLKRTQFTSDTRNVKTYTISPEINYKDVDELIKYIEFIMALSNGYVHLEDLPIIANEYVINQYSHGLVNEYLGSIKKMTDGSAVECSSISGVLMRVTTYRAGIIDGVVTELDNNPYHAVLETDEVNAFFSNADYTKQQPLYNQLMSNIFNKES